MFYFFFSRRRRHTRWPRDWSSDVCSSDLEMTDIKGIGKKTIAAFLAEVGDVNNYSHPDQIIKLAGLNLKLATSGKWKGKTVITKRGRPKLRALLFKVILPLVNHNPAFKALHEYFTTRKDNTLM